MKKALFFLLFCTSNAWASCVPSVVQVSSHEVTTAQLFPTFITTMTATTAGDAVACFVREGLNNTDNFTMSDEQGQTWLQTNVKYFIDPAATTRRASVFYFPNSLSITFPKVTFSTGGGCSLISMTCIEMANMASSVMLDTDTFNGLTTATSHTTTGLTTANANDLLVVFLETGGAVTSFAGSNNYTMSANAKLTRTAVEYETVASVLTSTTTVITWTTTQQSASDFVAFKGCQAATNTPCQSIDAFGVGCGL